MIDLSKIDNNAKTYPYSQMIPITSIPLSIETKLPSNTNAMNSFVIIISKYGHYFNKLTDYDKMFEADFYPISSFDNTNNNIILKKSITYSNLDFQQQDKILFILNIDIK
jgi:hypothetical protein